MPSSFNPSKLISNRHLQTIYPSIFRPKYNLNFEIEEFVLSDGDFIDCYWLDKNKSLDENIVIIMHGLGGSYKSRYIQGTMNKLSLAGFSSVLMHFRGCSGRVNRFPKTFHIGEINDAKEWIEYIIKKYPKSKIHLIGFSLGANVLLKLLGSTNLKIFSATAISPPLDLVKSANSINKGVSKLYQYYMVKKLNRLLLRKYENKDFEKEINLKKENIKKIKTFLEFDSLYTAPVHGFNSAYHYYKKSSSIYYLDEIKVPTLIIMSKNDPVTNVKKLPNNISSFLDIEFYETGGHVGFFEGTLLKPKFWLEKRILKYIKSKR